MIEPVDVKRTADVGVRVSALGPDRALLEVTWVDGQSAALVGHGDLHAPPVLLDPEGMRELATWLVRRLRERER